MLFQIKASIKFLIKSKNQHGIHSPFVFDLVTHCLYDKTPKKWYGLLEKYRNSLLKNDTIITVEDFGAGSKLLQNKERMVAKIAKNAGISIKRAKLLGRLAVYFPIENILEIGTSLGISTASLRLANTTATITTLEGCKATAQIAKENFDTFHFKNINICKRL